MKDVLARSGVEILTSQVKGSMDLTEADRKQLLNLNGEDIVHVIIRQTEAASGYPMRASSMRVIVELTHDMVRAAERVLAQIEAEERERGPAGALRAAPPEKSS